jgi:hypothetical protein
LINLFGFKCLIASKFGSRIPVKQLTLITVFIINNRIINQKKLKITMKKILAILVFIASYSISQAQLKVPKVDTYAATSALTNFVKPPEIGDIGTTSSSITDQLTSQLGLPASQKPGLTSAISSFLTDKKGILSLAGKNPADYLAKFNPLQQGLFGKLKGIMGATAFTKFLGLKPSGSNIAGNALSHLFF